MNVYLSYRTFGRMLIRILSIVVILAMAFPMAKVVRAAPTADLDTLIAAAQEEGSLTVIALPNDWCNFGQIIAGFTNTYNIPINSVNPSASSEDELQAIRDGLQNPGPDTPDVIDVGPGFAVQAKLDGLISPYQVSTWETIPDLMKDSEGYWYGDYYGVMSIVVNTSEYSTPASWNDLLTGEKIGPVALGGDPTVSNLGFFTVYAAALANGGSLDDIEPGLQFFNNLHESGRLLDAIGNGETLASGETPVLPEWSYLALAQRDANADAQIEIVVPPNPIASFYAQAISAYAPHPNAAKLWMEYLYSDEVQLMWLDGYCHPARFNDLLSRGVIPDDLLARLPDTSSAVFPSLDQIAGAEDIIKEKWSCVVYSDCPPQPWRDEFNGPLAGDWYWVNENQDKWSLTEREGFLRIYASDQGTGDANLLLRPVTPGDFAIETHLIFTPDTNFQFAGLVIWQDDANFLQFGRAYCDVEESCVGNGIYFDNVVNDGMGGENFATQVDNPFDPNEAYLRLERRGNMVRALYSHEGITWTEFGTHWIADDFQVNAVGLTSAQDTNASDPNVPADFDYFELTEGWGFLPEGFHDGEQGDVPSWACNVNGWAADPDDRTTDLAIEVNVDGTSFPDWLYAGEYREDLDQAGVCEDGNCSFSTPLWGMISSYEPHLVVTYAQDIPSGEWVTLSNSPKDLTCRTYDIYGYDPLTGQTTLITKNLKESDEYNPSWSPNGKKVAHDVVSGDLQSIYVTDVKTGASAPLDGAGEGSNDAVWSPNGKWIVFDRAFDEVPSLYLVPAIGGASTLVRENAVSADWAPSGKRLVFQQPSDGSIWTVPVDGGQGGEKFIVGSGANPAWSPDGNWIAYEKDGDIWKVQVNVQGTVFGDPIQMTSGPFWDGQPTWSADSTMIVYHSGFNGADFDLWTIPAAGGEPAWLTGAPNFGDYDPASARNSSAIAYGSFSPNGQAPRSWVAAFTYDLPAGYWTEGNHTYHFEAAGLDNTDERSFDVEQYERIYDGTVLLRPGGIRARTGEECNSINDVLNLRQPTQFNVGWTADGTYPDALNYFENLMAKVAWDGGDPVELVQNEIFPYTAPLDWGGYLCTFTAGPPAPTFVAYLPYAIEGYDWPMGDEIKILINDVEFPVTAISEQRPDFPEGSTRALFDVGGGGISLRAGDHIVMTDESAGIAKELWVTSLAVTDFDLEAYTVSGIYDPNDRLWVWLYDRDGQVPATDPNAGTWVATFTELPPEAWGGATQWDDDGDGTSMDFQVPTARVVIDNQPDWVSSGIAVSEGQTFRIEASGSMNPCSDTYPNGDEICIFYTPVGADWLVPYENVFGIFPGPEMNFMALLGRIDDGEPFYVNAGGTFTATRTGTLWFTPNDNLRTDNQGGYRILMWLE